MHACSFAKANFVNFLLQNEAKVGIKDKTQKNALFYAIDTDEENFDIVSNLLEALKKEPNSDQDDLFSCATLAMVKGFEDIALKILESEVLLINRTQPQSGNSLLHISILNKRWQLSESLVKMGADISLKNHSNCDPLDYIEDRRVCEKLLTLKARISKKNSNNNKSTSTIQAQNEFQNSLNSPAEFLQNSSQGQGSNENYDRAQHVVVINLQNETDLKLFEMETLLDCKMRQFELERAQYQTEINSLKGKIEDSIKGKSESKESKFIQSEFPHADNSTNTEQKLSFFHENAENFSLWPTEIFGDLHREILKFTSEVDDYSLKNKERFENLIDILGKAVKEVIPAADVNVYGSFATGLSLKWSDIDLVIKVPEPYFSTNNSYLLTKIEDKLRVGLCS